MKTPQQHVFEDVSTISRRNTRPKTLPNNLENSLSIPVDLIVEILSRLSAKSIARCRCVSKLWTSILRRPDFTELFLTRSLARPQLFFAYETNGEFFFSSSPQPQSLDVNSSPVSINHLKRLPFSGPCKILGLVQGLVCLIDRRFLKGRTRTVPVICNPSTGESLSLSTMKTRRCNVISFFGYDPIEKQYKILSMSRPRYEIQEQRYELQDQQKQQVCEEHQVLTLSTGKMSWRMIECCIPHNPREDQTGICINGGLYYQAFVGGFSKIICFDVRSEKINLIKKDKGMELWRPDFYTLVNYKGKLGALTVVLDKWLELWVLVDAGKQEWLKLIFVMPTLWKTEVAKGHLYSIGVTGTNELVLSSSCISSPFYIFYYNFERETIRRVEMEEYEKRRVFISLDYVEDVKLIHMFRT